MEDNEGVIPVVETGHSSRPGRVRTRTAWAGGLDLWNTRRRPSLADSMEAEPEIDVDGEEEALEVIVENERGWFLFGSPFFSSNSLLPFDAKPWTTESGEAAVTTIHEYTLPDATWKWKWRRWYVQMNPRVDDQGWSYALMFSKYCNWHASHTFLRSFVRKRTWVRLRVKADCDGDMLEGNPLASTLSLSTFTSRNSFSGPRHDSLKNTSTVARSVSEQEEEVRRERNLLECVRNATHLTKENATVDDQQVDTLDTLSMEARKNSLPKLLRVESGAPSARDTRQFTITRPHGAGNTVLVRETTDDPYDMGSFVYDLHAARVDRERINLVVHYAKTHVDRLLDRTQGIVNAFDHIESIAILCEKLEELHMPKLKPFIDDLKDCSNSRRFFSA